MKTKLALSAIGIIIGFTTSLLLRHLGLRPELFAAALIGAVIGTGLTYASAIFILTSDKMTRYKILLTYVIGACTGLFLFVVIIIYIMMNTKPIYL